MRVPAHTRSMEPTTVQSASTAPRVLVCAAPLVIEGLLGIGCDVVARTGFAAQLPVLAARVRPDVVLVYADRAPAPELIDRLRSQSPGLRVVCLLPDVEVTLPCEVLPQDCDASTLRSVLGVGPRALEVSLTGREIAVLRLAGEGLTNRAIASRLGIAENTVKNYLRQVHQKLDVRSRTEAVIVAARAGYPVLRVS